jgi:uncharacterized protein YukE
MSTGLNTEVTGDPASVDAVAHWLSDQLGPSALTGVRTLESSRAEAATSWQGTAGHAFGKRMASASDRAGRLQSGINHVSTAIRDYAAALRSAQHAMADIRQAAVSAGLTVTGLTIENPGAGPPSPVPPGDAGSPEQVAAHHEAVAAYEAHQERVQAWNTAVADAKGVRTQLEAEDQKLADKYRGLEGPEWPLTAADIAGGVAGAVFEFNASVLRQTAATFREQATRDLDRALRSNPAVVGHQRWYQDLDRARQLGSSADDWGQSADDLAAKGRVIPLKLGGSLAIAGVGYDIATGEDPVQAVTSGGGGFLASVGAGAAAGAVAGTLVPVPGVGTAAGAVIGAGAGIFTSGAIDSLFENGPDVEVAAQAGLDAVTDTGEAVGGAVDSAADAVTGLFD